MTPGLTTEAFLSLTLIMGAMLISTLGVARIMRWPWCSKNPSEDYMMKAAAPFFVAAAAAQVPLVGSFLGGLLALFAPAASWGAGETFGFGQQDATILFVAVSLVAVAAGAIAAVRVAKVPKTKETMATTYIGAAYTASGAVFCLLLVLLAFSGGIYSHESGYIEGAMLIAAGSVIGGIGTAFFRKWFVGALANEDFDQGKMSRDTGVRAFLFVALSGAPIVAGLVMIAT